MATLDALRQTPHLSVSALKLFLQCPRKYRIKYLDRHAPAFKPVALPFGTAFHDAVGMLLHRHGRGDPASREELHDHLRAVLHRQVHDNGTPVLFEDAEDEGQLVDRGMQMLDAFTAAVPLPQEVLRVELPFSVELFDPNTGEALPMPLIGAVDAVARWNGRVELVELKTAKRRWSDDAVNFDLQPTAYRMGVRSQGLDDVDLRLVVVTKAARPDVQVERLRRGPDDEHDLLSTAASVVRAVQAGVDHPVRSWACKTCEFAGVCR